MLPMQLDQRLVGLCVLLHLQGELDGESKLVSGPPVPKTELPLLMCMHTRDLKHLEVLCLSTKKVGFLLLTPAQMSAFSLSISARMAGSWLRGSAFFSAVASCLSFVFRLPCSRALLRGTVLYGRPLWGLRLRLQYLM